MRVYYTKLFNKFADYDDTARAAMPQTNTGDGVEEIIGEVLPPMLGKGALAVSGLGTAAGALVGLPFLQAFLAKKFGKYMGRSPEMQKKLYNVGLLGGYPGVVYNLMFRHPDTFLEKLKDRTINRREFYRK